MTGTFYGQQYRNTACRTGQINLGYMASLRITHGSIIWLLELAWKIQTLLLHGRSKLDGSGRVCAYSRTAGQRTKVFVQPGICCKVVAVAGSGIASAPERSRYTVNDPWCSGHWQFILARTKRCVQYEAPQGTGQSMGLNDIPDEG